MTEDPLVEQLRQRLGATEDGYRTAELAELLGRSNWTVTKLLRQLDAEGLLMRTWKRFKALDGRMATVPAYKLKVPIELIEDDDGS